jgi:hypothetical protein
VVPYVLSLVLLAVGLILLVAFLVQAVRRLLRFRSLQQQVARDLGDRSGLVQARVAGLRVAFAERFRR